MRGEGWGLGEGTGVPRPLPRPPKPGDAVGHRCRGLHTRGQPAAPAGRGRSRAPGTAAPGTAAPGTAGKNEQTRVSVCCLSKRKASENLRARSWGGGAALSTERPCCCGARTGLRRPARHRAPRHTSPRAPPLSVPRATGRAGVTAGGQHLAVRARAREDYR